MGIFQKLFKKEPSTIVVKQEIDYDKLADAIVKAQIDFKVYEKNEAEKQEEIDRKNWRKIIGYEVIDQNWTWRKKKWQAIKNDWATLKSVFTFKVENAKTPRLTFELMRLGTGMIYGICEWTLYLLGMFFIVSPFISKDAFLLNYGNIGLGFLSILFGKIIRIAKLEVENVKDKEMLNMIFSANMTFVSVILAVIAIVISLFQGGGCNCVK